MLKSPTINSSSLTSINCSIYDDHSMAKFSYLNQFFYVMAGKCMYGCMYFFTALVRVCVDVMVMSSV